MQKKIYLLSAFLLGSVLSLFAQTSISTPNQEINCGQTITIPITVTDFTNMQGLSFSLQWNPVELSYQNSSVAAEVSSGSQFNTNNTAGGTLGYSWFNVGGVTLEDSDTVVNLTFLVVGNNFNTTGINFTDSPTEIVGTQNLQDISISVTSGILTLIDNEEPTITCPVNQAATTVSGATSVAVVNLAPEVMDNCGIDSTTYTLSGATIGIGTTDASGTQFNIGTTTVTYTTVDFDGNRASCAFDVVVTAGTIGGDTAVTVRGGSIILECDAPINFPISVLGFDEITDLGATISWDTDQFTYVGLADFALAGLDSEDFDISQAASGTISFTWNNDLAQTLADEATLFNIQLTGNSTVSNAAISVTNVTTQQNNVAINANGLSGNISLQDTTSPTFSNCLTNRNVTALPGQLGVRVNDLIPTFSDNCSTPTLSYILTGATTGDGLGDASGTTFNIGITTVTYTATDATGRTATCSFTVTVAGLSPTDFTLFAESSSVSCATDDIIVNINVGAFDTIAGTQFSVNWDPTILNYISHDLGTLTDNVQFQLDQTANGRIGYTWFESTGVTLPDGSTLFTLHFSPNGGGTSSVNFSDNPVPIEVTNADDLFSVKAGSEIDLIVGTVEVMDTSAPVVTPPADQMITLAMGQTTAVVTNLDPIIQDDCGGTAVTYALTGATTASGNGFASGLTFNAGTTRVTYTVTDGGGNTQTVSSIVTLDVPGAMEVNVVSPNAECGGEPYKVDITVDEFRNGAGIQFSVNWDELVLQFDSIGNIVGLPLDRMNDFQTDQIADGKLGFAWFNNTGTGIDLADGTVLFSIYYTLLSKAGGTSAINITDNPVMKEGSVYAANVPNAVPLIGNGSTMTISDNTPPVVVNPFPETITRYVTADNCQVTGSWETPLFSDACDNDLVLIRSDEPTDSFGVGEYVITYTATDLSGNSIADSTIFIVRDTFVPVFMNCPTNFTVTANENCQAIANWTAPTVMDNCGAVTLTSSHQPGDILLETTTVTYTAVDANGNSATCSFVITVEGVNPIVFENFPGDIIVNAAQGQCGANIGWTPPTAIGGCSTIEGNATITSTAVPGDFFPVGVNTVSYTATDAAGVTVTNSFTITVVDNQEIVVVCPTDIEIQADGTIMKDEGNFINTIVSDSCSRYTITFNDIQAFDNCSPISVMQTQGPTSGSTFTFGSTTMEFVLSDTLGNSITCAFRITINETGDLQAATLDDPTCAGSDLRLSVNTLIGGTYQWTGPGGFIADIQNPVIPNAMTQNSGNYVVKVISENGCTIKDSITVGILSGPVVEATGNNIGCTGEGDTIRLFTNTTNGVPIQTYSWTGPGGFTTQFQNPIIPNATSSNVGQYIVTGTSSNGCSATDTVVVGLMGMVMPTLGSNLSTDTVCVNSPFVLTGTTYNRATYFWSAPVGAGLPAVTDSNALTITPTIPGTYTYAFAANLDGNCTSDTARLTLVVVGGAGTLTIESNGPFECISPNQTIDLMVSGGVEGAVYRWIGPNDFTSMEQNPSIMAAAQAAGTYTVVANTADGCTTTNSIDIALTVQGIAPEVTFSSTSANLCEGDALTLTGAAVPNATYAWTGPNNFTSSDTAITFTNIMAENAGAYQLTTTVNGCTSLPRTVGPINVLIDPIANDDVINVIRNQSQTFSIIENDVLLAGVPITINLLSSAANGTLVNNNDGTLSYTPTTDYVGMDQIAYEVCYQDCPDLCAMATMTIRTEFDPSVCVAPTFFSPNNDGFNDYFVISCVSDPPKAGSELIVYNEWGSEVFRQIPYENRWDGTYNGKDLPDGTYYYVYKRDSDDTEPLKGYVTLFR